MYNPYYNKNLIALYRFREKLAKLPVMESCFFRPEVVESGELIDKLLTFEELQYAVLKNNMVYYRGRFYSIDDFEFSGLNVSLAKAAEENHEEYCLQKHIVYFRNVSEELRDEYRAALSFNAAEVATGSVYSAYVPSKEMDRCVYTAQNSISARESIEGLRRAIQNMPADFGGALKFILDGMGLTQDDFETVSGISNRTLRRMSEDPDYTPKLKTVISICVALHLFPSFSQELIKRAGYNIDRLASDTDAAYKLIIYTLYDSGLDMCNLFLEEAGLKPLTGENAIDLKDL